MSAKRASGKSKSPSSDQPYVVYARRFRPQTFKSVVGQETVTGALRHALKTGRLAQAYLFSGPRGVGKTSLARIFAKAINCEKGKCPNGAAEEPCNKCDACNDIGSGRALDVVEMDAATNRGIDDIRQLRDNVGLAPAQFRNKVYIVDEVHMLSTEAWNAFLKTLEEPPPHVRFVFATTDPNKIPETIISRCQRFDLRRIGVADIVKRLKQICEEEGADAEDAALSRIASLSRGGLRDAEGLLDQAVNLGEGKVTDEIIRRISGAVPDDLIFDLLNDCSAGNAGEVLLKVHNALESGADPDDLLGALVERIRGVLLYQTCGKSSPLLEGHEHLLDSYETASKQFSSDQLLMLVQLFTTARRQVKDATQSRLPLETAMIRAARANDLVDLSKLVSMVEKNPGAVSGGSAPRTNAAAAPARPQTRPTRPSAAYGRRDGPDPNAAGRRADIDTPAPAAETSSPIQEQSAQEEPAPIETRKPEPEKPAPAPRKKLKTVSELPEHFPGQWDDVIRKAEEAGASSMLMAMMRHAAGAELDETKNQLTIILNPRQLFYQRALESKDQKTVLKFALQEVFGKAIKVKVAKVESVVYASGGQSPAPAATPPDPVFAVESQVSTLPPLPEKSKRLPEVKPQKQVEPEPDPVSEPTLTTADDSFIDHGITDSVEIENVRFEDLSPAKPEPKPKAKSKPKPEVVEPEPPKQERVNQPSAEEAEKVKDHPLVKKVLELTDGAVVKVYRQKREKKKK